MSGIHARLFRLERLLTKRQGICQDDAHEWERESSKMSAIYSQAYLVLAATGAEKPGQGLFFSRTPPAYETFTHTKKGTTGTVHAFAIRRDSRVASRYGYPYIADEPLSTRGWVLQERILASRTLHFASDQTLFECYGHFRSEDGYKTGGRVNCIHPLIDSGDPLIDSQHAMYHSYMYRGPAIWYQLLREYCSRKLTKDSDKLPALSGLARIVEEQTGDTYVAGLWRSTLLEGILWQAIGASRGRTSAPSEYRAPSWSWASIDGPFGHIGLKKDIQYMDKEAAEWRDIGTILDCHVEPKGENPYGEVTSGWLTIRAPVERLTPSEEKEPDHETVPHKRNLRLRTARGTPFGAYTMFDTLNDETILTMELFAMPLACIEEKERGGYTYQALIVTPVEGRQKYYRRVGKILFDQESLGDCEWIGDGTKMETVTLI